MPDAQRNSRRRWSRRRGPALLVLAGLIVLAALSLVGLEADGPAEREDVFALDAEEPSRAAEEAAMGAAEQGALEALEGTTGAWNSPTSPMNRYAIEGPSNADPHMAREQAAEAAQTLGALGTGDVLSGYGGGAEGLALRGTGRGGGGGRRIRGRAGLGGLRAAKLPQSGVLASGFVGGAGVAARLDDLLDRGVQIDGEHVRLEAFQDRERVTYPIPSEDAIAVYAEAERSRVHAAGDTVHLQVALVARRGEAPARPPMDVRLVFDRSGSMRSVGKWQHAVAAAHALVDRLAPSDTFGLVSYSDEASIDLAPSRVGNGQPAHAAIDRMQSGGGTNLSAALAEVHRQPPVRRGHDGVALVMVISDGRNTVGLTDPAALGAQTRELFDEGGVLTTTVGLGTDFDEECMLTLAREGSGSYHFVRRAADVGDILEDELDARVQAVAQGLRVRIELAPGVVARRVYGSRLLDQEERAAVRATEVAVDRRLAAELGIAEDRQREQETGLRLHIPTFRRGDQHVILLEVDVPAGSAGSVAGLATVHLDYKDLRARENRRSTARVNATRDGARDAVIASVQRPVKRTVLAFQAGDALQEAAAALSSDDLSAARARLSERRDVLAAAASLWSDSSLRRDADLLGRYERVLDGAWQDFGSGDRRTLAMAMNYFGDQRMR